VWKVPEVIFLKTGHWPHSLCGSLLVQCWT